MQSKKKKLSSYFRRGEDFGKPSKHGKSWRKTMVKRNRKSFKHIDRLSKSGNLVTEGLYDRKVVMRLDSGKETHLTEFTSTFSKPVIIGKVINLFEIIGVQHSPNIKVVSKLQQAYFKDPTNQLLAEQLHNIRIEKSEYTLRNGRFRVTSIEKDGNQYLALLKRA